MITWKFCFFWAGGAGFGSSSEELDDSSRRDYLLAIFSSSLLTVALG